MNEPIEIICEPNGYGDIMVVDDKSYKANTIQIVVMNDTSERYVEPSKTALWQQVSAKGFLYRTPYRIDGKIISCYGLVKCEN